MTTGATTITSTPSTHNDHHTTAVRRRQRRGTTMRANFELRTVFMAATTSLLALHGMSTCDAFHQTRLREATLAGAPVLEASSHLVPTVATVNVEVLEGLNRLINRDPAHWNSPFPFTARGEGRHEELIHPVAFLRQPKHHTQQARASSRTPTSPSRLPSTSTPSVASPKSVVFLGGPASGKGTQCKLLAQRQGLVHLSTGDMLREAVKQQSEEGMKAKSFMGAGELVPDEVVAGIISERLQDEDCQSRGYILDGFPRTRQQARFLKDSGISPDVTVLLDVPEDQLIQRVVGRRLDPETGKIYHLQYLPPPQEVKSRLLHRDDDRIETVAPRIRRYNENLEDIIEELEKDAPFFRVDGCGEVDDVSSRIQSALKSVEPSSQRLLTSEGWLQNFEAAELEASSPSYALMSEEQLSSSQHEITEEHGNRHRRHSHNHHHRHRHPVHGVA
eukprot:CAMPEP_0198122954 /NCGR_PEP_ID=MMETSP1442-20131203/36290_1 /TAXON_ID= /ORGANISM="Craspedostauros australis, Strain CCMP3328" /LENGTH=446 /DNA_ID=CAMNT_0043782071 /DNA_START=125 /DNA_END=1465 /DNA_ORIENTATION=-